MSGSIRSKRSSIAGQRRGFGGFDRDGHESAGEGSQGKSEASRVLQLREIARKSGYPQLIEATDIIQNAYRPVDTCQFISVSYKDDKGVKQTLPLSLAAME